MRNSWMESAFSSGEFSMNGPRPWTALQMAMKVTKARERFKPFGPKRTAAQSRIGKGTYKSAWVLEVWFQLNTKKLTRRSAKAKAATSNARRIDNPLKAASGSAPHITIKGTMIISARTFEVKRIRHTCQ